MTKRSFRQDILAQPENLTRAGASFIEALGGADLRAFSADPIVFTGMGASLFAAMPSVCGLRAGGRRAFALSPTEILEPGGDRLGGAHVALSQSGRSAETVAAMRAVGGPRLALTATGTGPLADVCEVALPIGSRPDAGISVLTYTASLFAGAVLGAALGGGSPPPDLGRLAGLVGELCEQADVVARRAGERLAGVRAVDAIGRGFSFGPAGYSSLLLREAGRMPTALFDTHQYLHGPIEAIEPGTGAVLFGNGREVQLARDLAAAGATVVLVTDGEVDAVDGADVIRIPRVLPQIAPILEAVPAQLLADHLARCRGLDPGTFRHEQADTKLPTS